MSVLDLALHGGVSAVAAAAGFGGAEHDPRALRAGFAALPAAGQRRGQARSRKLRSSKARTDEPYTGPLAGTTHAWPYAILVASWLAHMAGLAHPLRLARR